MIKSSCKIYADGDKVWRNDVGELHRENGPADETTDGYKCWCLNNIRHRLNGPSHEYPDDECCWWKNNELISIEEIVDE